MRRVFVDDDAIQGDTVHITGDLAHHLGVVLRLPVGTHISVSCGDGTLYEVELQSFRKDEIEGAVIAREEQGEASSLEVVLYQGMPKGDKLEWIIQKCTELGISRIVPTETSRAVVKLDGEKVRKKQERWQKIAQEAGEQAKRLQVPTIAPLTPWNHAVEDMKDGLTIVFWEEERQKSLREYLQEVSVGRINLVIGPEGGLSEEEVEQLRAIGAVSVSLGNRILRTETAAMAATALVFYEFGELGG